MRKPVGLLVKHALQGQPPTHMETADLFAMADMLPPIEQAHLARLRYCKRLLQYCPQALWTFLDKAKDFPSSWITTCEESLRWFHKFYPHQFGPGNDKDFQAWVPYIAMDDNWKGRLKSAAKACVRFGRAQAEYHIWQK